MESRKDQHAQHRTDRQTGATPKRGAWAECDVLSPGAINMIAPPPSIILPKNHLLALLCLGPVMRAETFFANRGL